MLFTEQHDAIRNTISRFVDEEINPHTERWEAEGIFPASDLFEKMGELGLLGISKPEEYGGMGLDYSYEILFAEELGRINCGSIGIAIGVQTDMATPALAKFGSDYVKKTFLTQAISGKAVFCLGVTEPHAGSDVANISTKAVRDGDDYVINGTKMWITNSTQADYICLLVNTGGENRHANKSLIIVPTNSAGVSFSDRLEKLGMHASDTAQIFFDDVRVPAKNLVGEEGHGFFYQMFQFQEERLFGAAGALKAIEHCIQSTIEYTQQRIVFGKPLIDQQSIHFRLAELQSEIELLRALIYDVVEGYLHGTDVTIKASMAKLKAGRLSREVTDACLQYWGGMGYMWDNLVSRAFRDLRLTSIGGGADEVMLSIISKKMGILPRG
ncbi:MAG: acyl-CoA dehydrogenase family protein [Pseudomonadota bacterium]